MTFANMKKGMLLSALFYIAMGVVMVIWPSEISLVLCYVFGGVIGILGIIKIVQYFTNRTGSFLLQFDLIIGMLALVVSALFLLQPTAILAIIPIVIGIILLTDSIIKLQLAFQLKKVGYDKWWISLILAVVCAIAAILLITNPFKSNDILIMVAGISFIVDGLIDLWSLYYIRKAMKLTQQV